LPGLIDGHSDDLKIMLDGIIKDLRIAGIDDAEIEDLIHDSWWDYKGFKDCQD
jgi:hypothetical protein